jgi:hypothetical protein
LISELNKKESAEVIQAKKNVSLANELGHLQFENVIAGEY